MPKDRDDLPRRDKAPDGLDGLVPFGTNSPDNPIHGLAQREEGRASIVGMLSAVMLQEPRYFDPRSRKRNIDIFMEALPASGVPIDAPEVVSTLHRVATEHMDKKGRQDWWSDRNSPLAFAVEVFGMSGETFEVTQERFREVGRKKLEQIRDRLVDYQTGERPAEMRHFDSIGGKDGIEVATLGSYPTISSKFEERLREGYKFEYKIEGVIECEAVQLLPPAELLLTTAILALDLLEVEQEAYLRGTFREISFTLLKYLYDHGRDYDPDPYLPSEVKEKARLGIRRLGMLCFTPEGRSDRNNWFLPGLSDPQRIYAAINESPPEDESLLADLLKKLGSQPDNIEGTFNRLFVPVEDSDGLQTKSGNLRYQLREGVTPEIASVIAARLRSNTAEKITNR